MAVSKQTVAVRGQEEAGRVEDSQQHSKPAQQAAAALARVQEFINRSAGQHLRAIKGR